MAFVRIQEPAEAIEDGLTEIEVIVSRLDGPGGNCAVSQSEGLKALAISFGSSSESIFASGVGLGVTLDGLRVVSESKVCDGDGSFGWVENDA
jgi:hypothetical protein